MKTIYLKENKAGNFKFSNRKNATESFKTQKAFKNWYNPQYNSSKYATQKHSNAIIKATYSQSQTYFSDATEVLKFIKKHNIF